MKAVLLIIFILFVANTAKAFPQMIRHGYTSCTSCHVSPRGGEMLTDYGRALSGAAISKWAYEGEEQWHYGALEKTPEWLKVGGDFRSLQLHRENASGKFGRYIEMQEQVQVAAKIPKKNTYFSVTAASYTREESKPWYIPGFFFLTQLTDTIAFKIGKFIPRFGINVPEHIFSTRGAIGMGPFTERQTAEVYYTQNKWDLSLSATSGELKSGREAEGFYAQVNYSFGQKDRVGLSLEKKMADDKAFSVGVHALWGLTEKVYFITDSVYRDFEGFSGAPQEGFYHFSKLGYEFTKGFHLFVMEDIRKNNLSESGNTDSFYGVGMTLFPRPHFEFQLALRKLQNLSTGFDDESEAYVLFHYYL